MALVAVHGTGTPLGDPIEVGALGQALGGSPGPPGGRNVVLVSVKSCYGHTEGAAGLTGALLAVQLLQAKVCMRKPPHHVTSDSRLHTWIVSSTVHIISAVRQGSHSSNVSCCEVQVQTVFL